MACNTVGAPLSGMISDRIVVAARKRRGNIWVPEDRLHATLIGAAVFVPCSVLFVGLILRYIDGTPGIVLICVCFFINGLGVCSFRWRMMLRELSFAVVRSILC